MSSLTVECVLNLLTPEQQSELRKRLKPKYCVYKCDYKPIFELCGDDGFEIEQFDLLELINKYWKLKVEPLFEADTVKEIREFMETVIITKAGMDHFMDYGFVVELETYYEFGGKEIVIYDCKSCKFRTTKQKSFKCVSCSGNVCQDCAVKCSCDKYTCGGRETECYWTHKH